MRNVPEYAKVDKFTYRKTRDFVMTTARIYGFHEVDMWNLVIEQITKRHANVIKNKAKNELTLVEAADKICKEAKAERAKIEAERDEAAYDAAGGHA